jgi:recyclin-1
MDKFKTLEPIRLHGPTAQTGNQSKSSVILKARVDSPLIGRLPSDLHLLILIYLPIPDFPSYSRICRAAASLSRHEKVWEARWLGLGVDRHDLATVLDQLEAESTRLVAANRESAPPILAVEELEDDFGDFNLVSSGISADFGEFSTAPSSSHTFRSKYIRAHKLLKPLTSLLSSPPHLVLTSLASALGRSNSSLRQQATTLYLFSRFLSAPVQPCLAWLTLAGSLRLVMDRFEASLLAAFDVADSKQDEPSMREAAFSSWEVRDRDREERVKSAGGNWEWELGKVWAEKREIFYEQAKWDPLANIKPDGKLEFDAMDEFMGSVIAAIKEDGARAVRVFPPESGVLLVFAERLANDVVCPTKYPCLLVSI